MYVRLFNIETLCIILTVTHNQTNFYSKTLDKTLNILPNPSYQIAKLPAIADYPFRPYNK